MPIVHSPPICSKILFFTPVSHARNAAFCSKKVPKKMKKKAFSASKNPQNSPKRTHFKKMPNTITHKRITKNHPICHPLRLENYFSAFFCLHPPKKNAPESTPNRPLSTPKPTPLDPQTDPSRPPNRPLRDSKQHVSDPQQGSFFHPFEPHKSIESLPPQIAYRQQSERHVKYI